VMPTVQVGVGICFAARVWAREHRRHTVDEPSGDIGGGGVKRTVGARTRESLRRGA
jgi:hypothetical protein